MAIKFLTDHRVEGPPLEQFKAGQVVTDRSPESEQGFVRRRVAGYWDAKAKTLTDHEGKAIADLKAEAPAVEAAVPDRRDEGLRSDGTPPRATSGPRSVVTSVQAGKVTKAAPATKAAGKAAAKPKAPSRRAARKPAKAKK